MAFAVLDVADPVDAASVCGAEFCGAEFAATGAAGVAATGGTELAAAGAAGVVAACAPVSTVGFAAGDPTGLPADGGAAGKPLVASDWVSVRSAIRLCVSFSRSAVVVARVGGGGTVAR